MKKINYPATTYYVGTAREVIRAFRKINMPSICDMYPNIQSDYPDDINTKGMPCLSFNEMYTLAIDKTYGFKYVLTEYETVQMLMGAVG